MPPSERAVGFAPVQRTNSLSRRRPLAQVKKSGRSNIFNAWSVHDGKFFAESVRAGIARAPNERSALTPDAFHVVGLLDRWAADWQRLDSDRDKESLRVTWRPGRAKSPAIPLRAQSPRSKLVQAGLLTRPERVLSVEELAAHPSAASFADYKLLTQLGMGQFASVYHAVHLPTGVEVAMKLTSRAIQRPPPRGAAADGDVPEIDPMDVDCFTLETSVLLELSQSAEWARTSAADEAEGAPGLAARYRPIYRAHGLANLDKRGARGWVAMELVHGTTLLRHLKTDRAGTTGAAPRRRVDLIEVISLMRDVALELAQLHELGVIHRDLKETNVMVTLHSTPGSQPQLKAGLVDFGLALSFDPPIDKLRTDYQLQQRVGVYGYMAPEVFRCGPYGWGVDIFAFGVLVFRSLKAALPRPRMVQIREWAAQLPFKLTGTSYGSYCAPLVSPAWPRELSSIVTRCCAADQEKRPPMATVLRELDAWLADVGKGAGVEGRSVGNP
jgi:serine/threonine protein kinase